MAQQTDLLTVVRTARASAKYLRQLCDTGCLTATEANRLLTRIDEGFDAVMGKPDEEPRAPFAVIEGGRA
jgi:hypothetical protein